MQKIDKKIFVALVLMLHSVVFSQTIDTLESNNQKGKLIIPYAFYSPETSVGVGTSALLYNYKDRTDGKPNQLVGNGILTVNKQISLLAQFNRMLPKYKYIIDGQVKFEIFPIDYYGIGAETSADIYESYTPIELSINISILSKIYQNVYIGPQSVIFAGELYKTESEGILEHSNIEGIDGALLFLIGSKFKYDTRDKSFFPSKGMLIDNDMLYNSDFFYNGIQQFKLTLDISYFHSIYENHILAFNYYGSYLYGDIPFQYMNKLGGASLMRGYYEGRFRDKCYQTAQLEYRYPLFWRFGGVLFGSMGNVSSELSNFFDSDLKYSYGLGLRFAINKEEKLNIRLDFGFTDEDINFYISGTEAF